MIIPAEYIRSVTLRLDLQGLEYVKISLRGREANNVALLQQVGVKLLERGELQVPRLTK